MIKRLVLCASYMEKNFKGAMIPFGDLVYFKPSGARSVEQNTSLTQWEFQESSQDTT